MQHSRLSVATMSARLLPYRFHDRSPWKHAGRKAQLFASIQCVTGAPGRIRTSDPQIRSLVLYPAELRAPAKRWRMRWEVPAARDSYRLCSDLARRSEEHTSELQSRLHLVC